MKQETKQIIAEMGRDAKRTLARAGELSLEGLAQVVCKASYPILGNLSANLQGRIENLVGKEYYNMMDAYETTLVTNFLIGVPLSAYLLGDRGAQEATKEIQPDTYSILSGNVLSESLGRFLGFASSCFYLMGEAILRQDIKKDNRNDASASLPGKIVSLPFDGLSYAYDAGKKYLQNVKNRVSEKYSGE
ncbi:MAG: hypothetical protein ABIF88_02865 [archaeon]